MKNLMIFTGGKLPLEDEILLKIQIDNSLDLGWEKDDILLVTDFYFQYNGIQAIMIPEGISYSFDKQANKIAVVLYLLKGFDIKKDEVFWCHDLDAFELHSIKDIDLEGCDLGLVHYFYKNEWCLSNFFFTPDAVDIIELINNTMIERPWKTRNNEKTLTWLIKHGKIDSSRYKRLNVTYNIAKRCLDTIYKEADSPLRVLHFRPSDKDDLMPDTALNMFMYGKNSLKIPLMTDRLIGIFNKHGIK